MEQPFSKSGYNKELNEKNKTYKKWKDKCHNNRSYIDFVKSISINACYLLFHFYWWMTYIFKLPLT